MTPNIDRHGIPFLPPTAPLEAFFNETLTLCPSCGVAVKPQNQMVCRACEIYLAKQESNEGIWQ